MSNNSPKSTSLLTLSIVHLDQSIRQIGQPVADFVTCVLDQHSCITAQDAIIESLLVRPNPNDTTFFPPIIIKQTKEQPHTTALRSAVKQSILRYIRDNDRWTGVTSLLLKSLAWYRSLGPDWYNSIVNQDSSMSSTYNDEKINDDLPTLKLASRMLISDTNQNKILPIIDLPRTKYNRPYLPKFNSEECNTRSSRSKKNDGDEDTINENRNCIMNISHQYPWVCMVQQQQQQSRQQQQSQYSSLGIDVVIFHAPTNQYTPTIFDFVSSFSHCFTSWEWDRIMNYQLQKESSTQRRRRSDVSMLREFYLRWSIKEAFTKAIGLGMQMDFQMFETRLCHIDDDDAIIHQDEFVNVDDGGEGGIWTSIARHAPSKNDEGKQITRVHDNKHHPFSVLGRVSRYSNPLSFSSSSSSSSSLSSVCEEWEFFFVPLNNTTSCNETDNRDQGDNALLLACACICIGPVLSKENPSSIVSAIERRQGCCINNCTIESLTLLNLIEMHENNSK